MTKRIFRSICVVAISVFLASIVLFMGVLYDYFSDMQRNQLRMQAELVSRGVYAEGLSYLQDLDIQNYRITWIGIDGTVRYDSQSDMEEMENHLEREEIREAFSSGMGESSRYSATLLERFFYCARRLPDGTVLRVSIAQNTLLTILFGMSQPLSVIFVTACILSLVLAFRLSKQIVKPLNELNLDEPLKNDGYDEIIPLLRRIDMQRRQIRWQEEKLRQKQSEFETVTGGMAEGIVLLNDRLLILGINPAAARLFDTDADYRGKNILSLNRSPEFRELLQQAGDGQQAEMIMELEGRNYQFQANPVISDGLVSGIALLLLDVTEKEKNEQIRREFTANVSHELRTPLHTISGSAELLMNGMVKVGDVPEFSRRIYKESQRMIRLVEDIIKLSHLDEGADNMLREETDLNTLAGETVQALLPEAERAGVELEWRGESVIIYGIPRMLMEIMYNLCDNAIKYNRQGGCVSITVKREDNRAVLSVADTGIGIPEEHHERIFERFYRVDKSRSKEIGGTGLGLSIVKHAAKLHGASVELESAAGSGTVIRVIFPL